jgi:hypothetical protein
MRQLGAAVAAACAVGLFVGEAAGQSGGNGMPAAMPGQVVGTPLQLNTVGTPVQRAAPPAGDQLGNPLMRPYDPTKPLDVFKGTAIDPKTVIAPVMGYPGTGGQDPNLLERLYQKLATVTGFYKPSDPQRPTYTPGISRRNRERAMQRLWRRD